MRTKIFIMGLAILFSISCASIENYHTMHQPENSLLTASIGSTVFRLNKSSNLPNVFGKADLWGEKVDRGYTELKLKGIKENGNLILQITDIDLTSTETTLDRVKKQPQVVVDADNKAVIGNESTPDTTVFEFDPRKENFLVIGGVRITFVETTSYSIKYRLKKEVTK